MSSSCWRDKEDERGRDRGKAGGFPWVDPSFFEDSETGGEIAVEAGEDKGVGEAELGAELGGEEQGEGGREEEMEQDFSREREREVEGQEEENPPSSLLNLSISLLLLLFFWCCVCTQRNHFVFRFWILRSKRPQIRQTSPQIPVKIVRISC